MRRGTQGWYKVLFFGFLSLTTALFFSNPSGYAEEVIGVTDDTIKIGHISDLTGPAAFQTLQITNAFKDYLLDVNDRGGINGRKVKILVEDDRFTIPQAIACFKKLVHKDQVFAFNGPSNTGATFAMLHIIQKEKIPSVVWSIAESMTTPVKRYVFTPAASYEDEFEVLFNYLMNVLPKRKEKIAIVHSDNEMGKTGLRAARYQSKKYGLKLYEEILNTGALEADSQVLRLRRNNPDYILAHLVLPPTLVLLKHMKKYKVSSLLVGTHCATEDDIVKMGGKATQDFFGVHAFNGWYDSSPGMVKLREVARRYHPKIEKRTRLSMHGWVMGAIMAEGLRRGGRDLSREGLVEAFESMKDYPITDVSGPITYSPNDHKGGDYCRIYKGDVKKGFLIPVTDWMK